MRQGVNFTLVIVRLGLERRTAAETISSIVIAHGCDPDTVEGNEFSIGLNGGGGGKIEGLSKTKQSGASVGQGSSQNLPIIGDEV